MSTAVRLPDEVGVRLRVPATSANLGPAFDAAGLCLTLYDDLDVRRRPSGCSVEVSGEGAHSLPDDESHLVLRAVRAGLDHAGVAQPGLALRAHNRIPHGRGLGSSAAATVGGLLAARELARTVGRGHILDDGAVLALATAFEGHADNVGAALLGGLTLVWSDPDGTEAVPDVHAVRVPVVDGLAPVVLVPTERLSTDHARGLLPPTVPHPVAAQNAARAALLVLALSSRPDLLLAATVDALHQPHRTAAFPASMALLERLRSLGHAAVISGAGPSVLVLGDEQATTSVDVPPGWTGYRLRIDLDGAQASLHADRPGEDAT